MANTSSDDEVESSVDDTDQGSRTHGVEFGDLEEALETHEYPTSVDTLLDEYGDHELELPSGEESFEEILGPYADDPDQQFNDAEEVRQAVLNMVGDEAVGEKGYSDRGIEDDEQTESF